MSTMSEDYQGQHQPSPDGVTLDRAIEAFPSIDTMPDIYSFGPAYGVSITQILTHRGKPAAWVRVYRAVPPGVDTINPGDWVTTSREYARQHAIQDDDEANDWPVIDRLVRAGELRTDGDDVNEWGYFPES